MGCRHLVQIIGLCLTKISCEDLIFAVATINQIRGVLKPDHIPP